MPILTNTLIRNQVTYSSSLEEESTTYLLFIGESDEKELFAFAFGFAFVAFPSVRGSGRSGSLLKRGDFNITARSLEIHFRKHLVFNLKSFSVNFFHWDWELKPNTNLIINTKVIARLYTGTFQKSSLDLGGINE